MYDILVYLMIVDFECKGHRIFNRLHIIDDAFTYSLSVQLITCDLVHRKVKTMALIFEGDSRFR